MHMFSKKWDHRLNIRHVFEGADELPTADETADMASKIADILSRFRARLRDEELAADLEEPQDMFSEIAGTEDANDARDHFNAALDVLYDVADSGKRIWLS